MVRHKHQESTPQEATQPGPETPPAAPAPQEADQTAQAEGQAAQAGQEQRKLPDPQPIITDGATGAKLMVSHRFRHMQIKFQEKPSRDVIDLVKGEGYRWHPQDQVWVKHLQPDTARGERMAAEKFFKELCDLLQPEKGEGQAR